MEEKKALTKTEPIVVRCIEPEDNAAVAQVIRSSVIEHGAPLVGTIYDDPHTDTMYQTFKEKNAEYWVIEHDGVILGGGGFYPTIGLPEGYAELTRLHFSPEARGKGIGKYLLQLIEKRAAKLGYTHMYLVSYPFFGKAISIYERYGYTHITEVLDESGLFEGAPYHMVKKIGTSTEGIGHTASYQRCNIQMELTIDSPICNKDEKDLSINILDYKPSLKGSFTTLVGNWLSDMLNGELEQEDLFTINNPGEAYLLNGGFVFFAEYGGEIVGCVALKRLDESQFEFAKLIVTKEARRLGVATKLIEKCIARCKENKISNLWLQTTNKLVGAHKLYYKMGFMDKEAPKSMEVLKRTENGTAIE